MSSYDSGVRKYVKHQAQCLAFSIQGMLLESIHLLL